MRYSDQQRIQKIYEKAVMLHEYIVDHQIKKEDLLTEISLQWIHDYDGTNWNIIADVVFEELPVLIGQLERLV